MTGVHLLFGLKFQSSQFIHIMLNITPPHLVISDPWKSKRLREHPYQYIIHMHNKQRTILYTSNKIIIYKDNIFYNVYLTLWYII